MERKHMNKYLRICLFGFLVWLIPFLVSLLIFSFHESNRPLFESIMPLALTITVVIFSVLYFKKLETNYLNEGILVGFVWLIINIIIDLIMFLPDSPMQMSFVDYMMDIGITYLIIPTIAIGIGHLLKNKKR